MAKLIYASNMSLDGWTEDERGGLRLGSAGRRRLRVHHQAHAVRRHVPLRAAHVRDAGRVGDRLHPGRAVGPHGRLRERMAGGGQGRLLLDPGRAAHREHSARTPLRPQRGTRPEGCRRVRICWSVARTSQHRLSSPGWSTSWPCSSGQSSSVGATPHCRPTRAPISSSSTSTDSAAASSTSATAFSSGTGDRARSRSAPTAGWSLHVMDRDALADRIGDMCDVGTVGGHDRVVPPQCSFGHCPTSTLSSTLLRAMSPPPVEAWFSLSSSTLQPLSRPDNRCCGPPRHASASTPAGTVGGSPRAIAARCNAHIIRSSRSPPRSALLCRR